MKPQLQEIPPRDENGNIIVAENVETYSNPETIDPYLATLRQNAAEARENEQPLINEKRTEVDDLIKKNSNQPIEQFSDKRSAEEKQTPPEEITPPKQKGNLLRKWMMTLGFVGAAATGMAKSGEKNPTDSTTEKGKKEVVTKVENSAEVSDQLRHDWNKYHDWLADQGLAGNPALDKNDLGGAMIDKYRKLHPETLVSRESIDDIQAEFAKYRQWCLDEIKAGRANFAPGVTESNFMIELSKIDNIAGQFTTRHKFPQAYMNTYMVTATDFNNVGNKSVNTKDDLRGSIAGVTKKDEKLIKHENQGFAKTKNDNVIKRMTDAGTSIAKSDK